MSFLPPHLSQQDVGKAIRPTHVHHLHDASVSGEKPLTTRNRLLTVCRELLPELNVNAGLLPVATRSAKL